MPIKTRLKNLTEWVEILRSCGLLESQKPTTCAWRSIPYRTKMQSGFQPVLLAVLLVLVTDRPPAAHGLFGPPSCSSNRDCPPINRCSSGITIFLTCPGGNQLLGGRCERIDNFFCRVGNPLGLGGNCAGRTCRQCYENSDCRSRGGGECSFGRCSSPYVYVPTYYGGKWAADKLTQKIYTPHVIYVYKL